MPRKVQNFNGAAEASMDKTQIVDAHERSAVSSQLRHMNMDSQQMPPATMQTFQRSDESAAGKTMQIGGTKKLSETQLSQSGFGSKASMPSPDHIEKARTLSEVPDAGKPE